MQQMTGQAMTTLAKSLDSSTGPGPEATTGARKCGNVPHAADSSATLTVHVTHNKVIATLQLSLGTPRTAQCVFERRRGSEAGWVHTKGAEFSDITDWISPELARLANAIPFPHEVANMLPGRRASAEAVNLAAQEVANG
ncbi:hypothetical protein MOQ21_10625 [Stenotrophomonas maltophilia]|uniref:hypothetical protein n=1 Tax=Stenotrophomonas geniculata TaxID=86188 RepID=UPI001F27353D|nr:hypothetical protein [Stenotrophomonas geniculata]MCF3475928.1 hypothetical protein [Stenotrophomonas maltophilia]MCI1091766.1 hypothetical protein [Stenotrophomonas maltophilia]MCI1128274.1 hypothetical protein [Stenotrophomonas maltophilia]MDC7801709.1 hypothetical protein [Stenotrophomonas geniculata]